MFSPNPAVRVVAPGSVSALAPPAPASAVSPESDAYRAGVAAGAEETLAGPAAELVQARESLERATAALGVAISELSRARERATSIETGDVVALAFELVSALAGHVPDTVSPELVRSALALAPEGDVATLRLHPDDYETVDGLPVEAKLVADPSIERGGCVVEVGATRIDAQRGPAISRLRRALVEATP